VLHTAAQHDGIDDRVAIEEPLEIRVAGEALAVTMRTPGHDEELAVGFLVSEGLIAPGPVATGPPADLAGNIVEVDAELRRAPDARRFYATSSCGICGKGALEEVAVLAAPLPPATERIDRGLLAGLPDRLVQPGFAATGGLHATGLFALAGEQLLVREDVGATTRWTR
jgi:FdhD protein